MHVRSEALELSDVAKEHRVRLWWSLYSLECSLNELTGRPTCISDRDISTPWPINVDIDGLHPGQSLYKTDLSEGVSSCYSSTSKDRKGMLIHSTHFPASSNLAFRCTTNGNISNANRCPAIDLYFPICQTPRNHFDIFYIQHSACNHLARDNNRAVLCSNDQGEMVRGPINH